LNNADSVNISDKEQPQKHDEGYKGILSNKDSFLYFLKKYIGAPWTNDISADDMERVDTSFVTGEYRLIDSDIIYKLQMNGADVYFYVLLELQSEVDFTMPFRMLRYMVELLNYIFKNTDEKIRERKNFRLPAIVPIILYNGDDNWTAARSYREYTENHEIFGDSIIDFSYLLFDLKRTDKEKFLQTKKLVDIIFSLERYRSDGDDVTQIAAQLAERTSELTEKDLSALIRWIEYVYYRGNLTPEFRGELTQIIKKGDMVSMKHSIEVIMDRKIELWKKEAWKNGLEEGREVGRQEGRQEGWQGGLQEGWREGIEEERRKNAKAMKDEGIDIGTITRITGLTVDEISRL
jgi:predicted transposase/invertase (TIGR01784 family)